MARLQVTTSNAHWLKVGTDVATGSAIVMLKLWVATAFARMVAASVALVSVTLTVKVDVPAVVGWPEITPVIGSMLNPSGRLPPTLNANGGRPPEMPIGTL